ncbi:glutamyl-tRNA reductase [Waddlia chondrophila 2032/99]|uniref:Glutamyl-tRNA reductase n=2 Tax=Waddlia chondrophila TaxID=71667 RepID=D6YS67_WADCW|nr:hypothetical protein [Waddlia chondrophila]ADI38912.1 putative glutamyl-tRNA reductase [Waddlia chondrophila WSU 86-1044]CCB90420.1 glutamyl-tRNA reductase [Waddlia chondrophila 2032/99]
MQIGVVGVNHKLADLKLRESFAKVCNEYFRDTFARHGKHNTLLLTTCNRTEVYFSSDVLSESHSYVLNILRENLPVSDETFDQKLYTYFGHDCFIHLARVTAGLDSAIVAETEIQGQVKIAYEKAADAAILPRELHYLFQKSLKIGKSIRSELGLGRGVPNLEHAVLNAGFHFFDKPEKANILFIGASDINCKILSFLQSKGCKHLTLCNRTKSNALEASKKYHINILDWEQRKMWTAFDWVIFGTKAGDHIISKSDLHQKPASDLLLIDLCVPRNVDPKLGREESITLLNIDQINRMLKFRKKRLNNHLSKAEKIVYTSTKRHIDLFHSKEERKLQLLATG